MEDCRRGAIVGLTGRATVVTVVILACSIWMLVEIGFLRGMKGVEQLRT